MKDAAREYFTVSKLPKKVGESTTLTLGEMIDKSMVVELTDGNGKKCDTTASYVKVTKIDDEYEMIVTLTCSGVTKSIKTKLGCYNYCTSDICESEEGETVILYQYKKTTDPYSKWTDWSKWSKNKVTPTSTKEVQTKIVNEQTGTTTEITNPTVTTVYSCPSGYTLSADNKKCTKPSSTTDVIASTVTPSYSCPSGYTLSSDNKKCTKSTTTYKDKVPSYSCPSGYTLSSDNKKCTKTLSTAATPHVDVSFSCVNGTCQTVTTIDYYYCSDTSYKLSGKTCTKTLKENPTISYSCPSGYTMNSAKTQCYKTTTDTVSSTVNYSYSCPSGYILSSDKKCTKTVTNTSTIASTVTNNYSCPSGYTLSADNKNCTKITNSTVSTTPTKTNSYSCAVGTLNSNNKCERKVPVYSDVTYYRYRTYETYPAKTYIKWSTSSNDQKLISQGYKYTGVTKEVTSK